jgi:hypothetical protein
MFEREDVKSIDTPSDDSRVMKVWPSVSSIGELPVTSFSEDAIESEDLGLWPRRK